ncbi:Fibronectin type III domain protein, partial [Acetivibrio thermocellus YS]
MRKFNRCVAIVLVVLLIGMTFDVPSFFPYRIQQVYAEKEQIDSGESVAESVYKKIETYDDIPVDIEPPKPPANLQLISKTSSTVSMSWSPAEDNTGVSYYNIYNGSSVVQAVYGENTSCTVSGLLPFTQYSFTVRAVDESGNVSAPSNTLVVTTLRESIRVNSNMALFEDKIYQDLYLESGSLNLNGYNLTIEGNLIHSGGTLNINGGKLIVKGDYRIQKESVNAQGQITYGGSDGILHMTNENDYVCVEGNFVTQSYYSHSSRLTDGVLEVKGDFIQKKHQSSYAYRDNFYASGKHKTILSGEKLQKVSFETAESRFNILELRNYSEDGVEFNQPLNANTFIDNGCKVKFAGSGAIGWTLADDETYEGDLYLGGGVLDLNGHELKVTGNLIQSGGTIDINGGKLYIEGDYRLQTENTDANGNKTYTYSNGYLKMTDSGSYIKVGGDFITQSQNSHEGYLTEGVLEVKGDLIQKRQNAYNNFKASGNHKVVLSGDEL